MGLPGLAACPRCGARPRNAAARFCARCGIELPQMGQLPSSVTLNAGTMPPPYMQPAGSVPPRLSPSAQHPLRRLPGRAPAAKKSNSGCGCLLTILIALAAFVFVGRSSRTSKPVVATAQPVVTVQIPPTASLPGRPPTIFVPSASTFEEGLSPILGECEVDRVQTTGTPHYRLRAQVSTPSNRRVLLTAYFLDRFGYSVRGVGFGSSNRDGTLSAGAWVIGSDGPAERLQSRRVELLVPVSGARTEPASVQFSLFDDGAEELARRNVSLVPGNYPASR